jgi:hypothetical protein
MSISARNFVVSAILDIDPTVQIFSIDTSFREMIVLIAYDRYELDFAASNTPCLKILMLVNSGVGLGIVMEFIRCS